MAVIWEHVYIYFIFYIVIKSVLLHPSFLVIKLYENSHPVIWCAVCRQTGSLSAENHHALDYKTFHNKLLLIVFRTYKAGYFYCNEPVPTPTMDPYHATIQNNEHLDEGCWVKWRWRRERMELLCFCWDPRFNQSPKVLTDW